MTVVPQVPGLVVTDTQWMELVAAGSGDEGETLLTGFCRRLTADPAQAAANRNTFLSGRGTQSPNESTSDV